MNKTDLIEKIKKLEGLTQDERATLIELVNTKKKYGLVWEDKPEEEEEKLRTQLPVLREVVEKRILAEEKATAKEDEHYKVLPLKVEAPDTLFPEMEKKEKALIETSAKGKDPNHILIEGDNLHALTALTFTHEGRIDVIYIDPPYNTGNKDFKYNDSFVDKEDSYRHSKWLSFMDKRLRIAKRLLSEKGVIFISIDENESHNLRLILDEIFGETNFIEQFVWNKRIPKNDKGVGNIHEYIFLYAKNYNSDHIFLQKKEGIDDVNELVENLKKRKIPIPDAELEIKRYYKKNDYDRGITLYNSFDENYKLWGKINVSWPNAKTFGPRYDILHPITKKPCKVPDRGWRWIESTFQSLVDYNNLKKLHDGTYMCGRIWFAKDENTQPSSIKYLDEVNDFLLRSILSTKSDGGNELSDIIGQSKFDYPKPTDLIHRLIASLNTNSIKILDFFAGSGTTLHATMQLNAEDGGTRQCIMVTNNEIDDKTKKELKQKGIVKGTPEYEAYGICQYVTYKRNSRVIKGYTNSKGQLVDGLSNNNLRYYKSEFVPSMNSEPNKRMLTQCSTDLLCIKEDCYQELTTELGFNAKQCRIFKNEKGKLLIVVYHSRNQLEVCEHLIVYIKTMEHQSEPIKLYGFSPEKETLVADFIEVADKIDAVPLPEAIYNAYRAVFQTLRLDKKPPTTFIHSTSDENEALPVDDELLELNPEEE